MMIKRWASVLVCCGLLSMTASGQEAVSDKETTEQTEATQQNTRSNPPEPDIQLEARPGSRFEPSEEVSEDLSISFPVDI